MTEDELKNGVEDLIREKLTRDYSVGYTAGQIIDLCRKFFEGCKDQAAIPVEMEEWWMGVQECALGVMCGSDLYKDKQKVGSQYQHIVRILLPKPETERQKLVRELRECADNYKYANSTGIADLLGKAADELEKVED